jgi:hypothetical protein
LRRLRAAQRRKENPGLRGAAAEELAAIDERVCEPHNLFAHAILRAERRH